MSGVFRQGGGCNGLVATRIGSLGWLTCGVKRCVRMCVPARCDCDVVQLGVRYKFGVACCGERSLTVYRAAGPRIRTSLSRLRRRDCTCLGYHVRRVSQTCSGRKKNSGRARAVTGVAGEQRATLGALRQCCLHVRGWSYCLCAARGCSVVCAGSGCARCACAVLSNVCVCVCVDVAQGVSIGRSCSRRARTR